MGLAARGDNRARLRPRLTGYVPNPNVGLDSDGEVRSYTGIGGYPLFYYTEDGAILSPKTVDENWEQVCDPDDPQWYVTGADVNWEDPHMYDDHTGELIECAYCEEEGEAPPDPWDEDDAE